MTSITAPAHPHATGEAVYPALFAYFLLFVEVNVFTLLALKSKRIELHSSAWRHFEDFFKLFLMVTDFNRFS